MTGLDLAAILKAEIQKCHEAISRDTRRKNILTHYATRLRLGKHQDVVRAELEAAGEPITIPTEEDPIMSEPIVLVILGFGLFCFGLLLGGMFGQHGEDV